MNQYRLVFTLLTIGATLFLGFFFGNMVAETPLAATKYAVAIAAVGIFLHVRLNREGLTQVQSCYYLGFIIATLLTWSPFKALAYLAPLLFSLLFVLALATTKNSLVLNRLLLTCLGLGALGLFYAVLNTDFSAQNFLIATITYSSFIPTLVIPTRLINNRDLLYRCGKFYCHCPHSGGHWNLSGSDRTTKREPIRRYLYGWNHPSKPRAGHWF